MIQPSDVRLGPADAGGTFLLEAVGLTASYGDLVAVRELSFGVRPGEIVALLGPNGAGKSTTLRACVGLLPRTRGEVNWFGRRSGDPLHRLARNGVAYVPEGSSITAKLSVRDNLRLGRGTVGEAMAIFPDLEGLLDRTAGLLSGGEQQMLVLSRALSSHPRALLIDELSLGLAPLALKRLLDVLRRAADEHGLAVLLVEQHARAALSVADRWYLLQDGRLVQQGDATSKARALNGITWSA